MPAQGDHHQVNNYLADISSYYMTDFLKGKLINYLLVFLLTACDFSLPLNELQRDLTEPKDRLTATCCK